MPNEFNPIMKILFTVRRMHFFIIQVCSFLLDSIPMVLNSIEIYLVRLLVLEINLLNF